MTRNTSPPVSRRPAMHGRARLAVSAAGLLALASAAAADRGATVDLGAGVELELVFVPKGTFRQGSPATEPGREDDETQREVTLTEDFLIGKYPVTVGQFRRFVEETRFQTDAERGQSGGSGVVEGKLVQRKDFTWRKPGFPQTGEHPVTLVTVQDAQAFTTWLSGKARRQVSLPTEAQWEYACRAGSTTAFHNGNSEDGLRDIGWYQANAPGGPQPVGQKQPNFFGLYDMSGNVYEWCRDVFGPYDAGPVEDPVGTRPEAGGPARTSLRGGSFLQEARHCRSAARYRNTPSARNADSGFRVVATVAAAVESPARGAANPPPAAPPAAPRTAPRPPAPVPAAPSGLKFGFPCWLALPCAVGAGIVLFLLVKVMRVFGPVSGGILPPTADVPRRPSAGALPFPEPADDGFWLPLSTVMPGSIIHYRCLVNGVWLDQTVVAESGGRQFVYTGGAPEQCSVVEVQAPGADMPLSLTALPPDAPSEEDRFSPPP